jgi:hypothetical protein
MLLFMAKSQEQTALWMSDERKRAEELRAEERRDAEERAELKETIRQDNLNQARLDQIEARNEARLEREAAAEREQKREDNRREERLEETRRYEANQERMAMAQAVLLSRLFGGHMSAPITPPTDKPEAGDP